MTTTYSISTTSQSLGPSGTKIADNWADLLDGSISDTGSMKTVGLFADVTADPPFFRTGSNSAGNVSANTCSGWTSLAGTASSLDSSNNAFTSDEPQACNSTDDGGGASVSILCVCF